MASETKAQQVERYLRSGILNGMWKAGDLLPSEHELLERLGVSRTTLRHALSALASEGLVVPHQGSGTFVAETPHTGIVAMIARADVLASPAGYFQNAMFEHTARSSEADGYRPVLAIGSGRTEEEFLSSTNLMDRAVIKDVVGVISYLNLGSVEDRLIREGISTVVVDTVVPVGKHCVILDYRHLIEMAVQTLRTHGCNDFALMRGENVTIPRYMFDVAAYDEAAYLYKAAVGFRDDRLITVPVEPAALFRPVCEAFKKWWHSPGRPNAIIFVDDNICDAACRAILELGIRVPEELAIITHANTGRDFHFPVELTRIEFDPVQVSAAAWSMLRGLISDDHSDVKVEYVRPVLREGASLEPVRPSTVPTREGG